MSKFLSAGFLTLVVTVFFASVQAPAARASEASQNAHADTLRVAALGDSLTQGYGLLQHEGFTAQLQAWLDAADAGATIVNAGVSGDTTAGGASRVGWTLSPDISAMIVALGGNDVLRGSAPEEAEKNLRAIMEAAHGKGVPVLLIGTTVPGNFGAEYKTQFEAIYPALAAEFDAAYFESFLGPLLAAGDMEVILRDYMQPDGVHPNERGVALIVDALGPQVRALIETARAARSKAAQ